MRRPRKSADSSNLRQMCSRFYESGLVHHLLGDSFHPGGERLTVHLGRTLGLTKDSKVLDVACGVGTSAMVIAKRFGSRVVGIDLSEKNILKGTARALEAGVADKVEFRVGDVHDIQLEGETFDAVISECALCIFDDKQTAVREMRKALRKGGLIGITDVTVAERVPEDLRGIVHHVACIGGAMMPDGYLDLLREAGFGDLHFEDHSEALHEIVARVEEVTAELGEAGKFCGFDLKVMFGITKEKIDRFKSRALREIDEGTFGYGLFIGYRREG